MPNSYVDNLDLHDQGAATRNGGRSGVSALGVRKRYGGIAALDGVDFRADQGEVHALLGENGAGKSTLIKILSGAVRPDEGRIEVAGEPVSLATRTDAQEAGIAAVFQELSLVPDLTVAQNVWFGQPPLTPWRTISTRRLRAQTRTLFQRLGIRGIDPDARMRGLSLAERQLVEIARAIARRPRVLILDEATSALSPSETEWLLSLARELAADGVCVIFISHRMAEVRRVADRVTIFRNGRLVGAHVMHEIDDEQIVQEMLGRKPGRLYPQRTTVPSTDVALSVEGLSDGHRLKGVDLELHHGEILGVGGLQGQGQSELLLALYGVSRARGRVAIDGVAQTPRSPRQALRAGIGLALVPEDRQNEGLLLPKSIKDNVILPVLDRVTRTGVIRSGEERALVLEGTSRLNLVASDLDQPAGSLSGGNQQKVVIAKLLLTGARILLLHDLVRGVDVGTKAEIFQLMRELAAQGYAILFYTTDLQELVNVSDRVLVIADGKVAATLAGDEMTEPNVLRAAIGSSDAPQRALETETAPTQAAVAALEEPEPGASRFVLPTWRRPALTRVIPYAILAALVLLYADRQQGVLTTFQLNTSSAETMTLILVATGQTIVILSGGFDLSVGGIVSLTTVIAATRLDHGTGSEVLWLVLILAGGALLGALNGAIITALRMDPFIVTLATWSIWSGAASLILSVDGGTIPTSLLNFGNDTFIGLATAVWIMVAILAFWVVFTRTRLGLEITAVGSSRTAAFLSGVRIARRLIAAYALSGLFSALAGLYLTTQTSTGSPNAGGEFILTSVAAVVIGGTAVAGGRATIGGTIAAAFILTVIGNVVFSFGLDSGWTVVLSGALLIGAVLVGPLPPLVARRFGRIRAAA
jgi:ribose transport system ATP-binding protein